VPRVGRLGFATGARFGVRWMDNCMSWLVDCREGMAWAFGKMISTEGKECCWGETEGWRLSMHRMLSACLRAWLWICTQKRVAPAQPTVRHRDTRGRRRAEGAVDTKHESWNRLNPLADSRTPVLALFQFSAFSVICLSLSVLISLSFSIEPFRPPSET